MATDDTFRQPLCAARQIEELYHIRCRAGGSPLKSWLDAQENRRPADIALAENRLNQRQNHLTLCKAPGGDLEIASDRSRNK